MFCTSCLLFRGPLLLLIFELKSKVSNRLVNILSISCSCSYLWFLLNIVHAFNLILTILLQVSLLMNLLSLCPLLFFMRSWYLKFFWELITPSLA